MGPPSIFIYTTCVPPKVLIIYVRVHTQAVLYFPILFVARVSWALQSFLFVFDSLPGNGVWATKNAATARFNSTSLASKLEVCELT